MAITTVDGMVAAARQAIPWTKTASATTVAAQWSTLLDVAGQPGAGSLTVGNTANGLLCDHTVAGFPTITAFGGGATGYLASVAFANNVACRFQLYDRLWHVGSISLLTLATTTLTAQPSFLGRTTDGAGVGLEIWLEINAAVSATATTVAVGYTNSDGTAGRTTAATASLSAYATRRLIQLPLQAGDRGVQRIDSVTVGGTVATTGTVNVIVARVLWEGGSVRIANGGDLHGWDRVGMPQIFPATALWPVIAADSTSSGVPGMLLTVING